jgi:heat shock protein HslJ
MTSTVTASSQSDSDGLRGTAWNAVELYGNPVTADWAPAEHRPHLVFGAEGRLSGADGCNRLTGPYTVEANGITFGQIAATQMACPETDEIAKRFRAALTGTSHWSIVKERLEFYGATGKPLAVFERRPATAPGGAAVLEGTTWQLVRFQGGDDRILTPDDPAKYTIEFAAGGQIAARVDCNRGRGTWKATPAGQLELSPLALTRARCAEGSLHDQIAKQWTYVRSFVIEDGHLFLSLMADGGTYEFAPAAEKKQ